MAGANPPRFCFQEADKSRVPLIQSEPPLPSTYDL